MTERGGIPNFDRLLAKKRAGIAARHLVSLLTDDAVRELMADDQTETRRFATEELKRRGLE
ncbi:hypothetical protein [Sphingomonas prati]|uniref:Uncharacterized protein n=1 Tax=Sphingomonas prati TaxID=1843237 RepID=A0A7W9BQS9_9SPHN|nr:hypothetical protein [Sphingomonas prati]MBB5728246.1 hypothetical protein [Sphingomonas prati]GGE75282.1 hypothetical protein GCM10011404_04830 [Sphingomonas prati]